MKMTTTMKKKPVVTKKESTKDKFVANKIGANIIVTYNKERYARKISKPDAEIVMKKMELYNRRPSETNRKAIITLLTPETTKKVVEKEKVAAKIKGYQKLQKKENKKNKIANKTSGDIMQELEEIIVADKQNITKIEAVLAKFKEVVVPEKQESYTSRRGEY